MMILRKYIRESLLTLNEARDKSWLKIMKDLYSHLPDFVFKDMYNQEKHGKNLKDLLIQDFDELEDSSFDELRNKADSLWSNKRPSGKEIINYLQNNSIENENYKKSISLLKSWESGETHWDNEKSQWWETEWESKKSKLINLKWEDLTDEKIESWGNKYTSDKSLFPMFGRGGSWDKSMRMIKSDISKEPIILKKINNKYTLMGGNNRVFNGFLKKYIQSSEEIKSNIDRIENIRKNSGLRLHKDDDLKQKCIDFYKEFFNFAEENKKNLFITINAYIAKDL